MKVNDVTVTSCDGRTAQGDVVLETDLGALVEHKVRFTFDGKSGKIHTDKDVDAQTALALLEAAEDFKEACKLRRDELRGMN